MSGRAAADRSELPCPTRFRHHAWTMTLAHLLPPGRGAWRSPAELERLQMRRLRALLAHACRHVPLYRRRFVEAGLRVEDVRTAADLARLPITTRQDLVSRPIADITADNVDLGRCVRRSTSGALGMPLTVYQRPRDRFLHDLTWARARLANGQRLLDRVVNLREPDPGESVRWFQRAGIWGRIHVPCLSDADLSALDRVVRLKPDVLVGYPSSLKLLARMMDERGVRVRPRLVFTMSEVMTDTDRRALEASFGVSICDSYGALETGLIAWQCPERDGYHINSDRVIVEWEWDGQAVPPGRRARVICTVLDSFAMPFIRYALGDVAVARADACPCGRVLPLMQAIEGRENDFLVLADGRWLSPDVICSLISASGGVRQFQLVQESARLVSLRLQCEAGTGMALAARLAKVLGPEVELSVTCSEKPVWHGPGKYRPVISKLAAAGPRGTPPP